MDYRNEHLFEKETDFLDPQFWKNQSTSINVGSSGYRTKTIMAGNHLEVIVYPIYVRIKGKRTEKENDEVLERKRKYNIKNSKRRLVRLLEANFSDRDWFVTLTYDGKSPDYDRVHADLENFIEKIKRRRKKLRRGKLKYIAVIEGDSSTKMHIHLIMNKGLDRDIIEACWKKGMTTITRIHGQPGYEALGNYFAKKEHDNGKNGEYRNRKWSHSQKLKTPKERVDDTRAKNAFVRNIGYKMHRDLSELKSVLERQYKNYYYVDGEVKYSDYNAGVIIRAVLRRKGSNLSPLTEQLLNEEE